MRLSVALLAEGVDRNEGERQHEERHRVALLAEGVDRNLVVKFNDREKRVALLAEGVDRNTDRSVNAYNAYRRPPRGGRG